MGGHPFGGCGDAAGGVSGGVDLPADEGRPPFGVGVAVDAVHVLPEVVFECRDIADHPVVGEDARVFGPAGAEAAGERAGVLFGQCRARGAAHVGDEGRVCPCAGLGCEGVIGIGGDRLLLDARLAASLEGAQAGVVGIAVGLAEHAVRGVEQPERRFHTLLPSAETEEPAHR